MSEFTKVLRVSPLGDGDNWILLDDFRYYDNHVAGSEVEPYWIAVPAFFMTDFASVPPVFRSLIARWGKHGNATVLHDYLYWEQALVKDRKTADIIFLDAMKIMNVPGWKSRLIYTGVRLGGGFAWRGNTKKRQGGWSRVAARWPAKATDTPDDLQTLAEA